MHAGLLEPALGFYSDLAGQGWVDWIYMIFMAAIGIALLLGIVTLAAIGRAIWMTLFYTAAAIWPENNPFLDDHLIELIILVALAYVGAGRYLGLGHWWEKHFARASLSIPALRPGALEGQRLAWRDRVRNQRCPPTSPRRPSRALRELAARGSRLSLVRCSRSGEPG